MIEHSSTPENLHSLVCGMRSLTEDVLEWAYICHLEKLMLESESYVRLCACLGMRLLICIGVVGNGLKDAIQSDMGV